MNKLAMLLLPMTLLPAVVVWAEEGVPVPTPDLIGAAIANGDVATMKLYLGESVEITTTNVERLVGRWPLETLSEHLSGCVANYNSTSTTTNFVRIAFDCPTSIAPNPVSCASEDWILTVFRGDGSPPASTLIPVRSKAIECFVPSPAPPAPVVFGGNR